MAQRMPMKFRYSIISVLMACLSIFVAAYLVWVISEYLSIFLNIPYGASIADQANGWLWFTLLTLEFLIVVTACYALWSLVFGKVKVHDICHVKVMTILSNLSIQIIRH